MKKIYSHPQWNLPLRIVSTYTVYHSIHDTDEICICSLPSSFSLNGDNNTQHYVKVLKKDLTLHRIYNPTESKFIFLLIKLKQRLSWTKKKPSLKEDLVHH